MTGQARFTHMQDGTQEDRAMIAADFSAYARQLPARILTHLKLLEGDFGGFPVDRLTHSLQTASRAWRDGRDEEYESLPLSFFELMMERVFAQPRQSIYKAAMAPNQTA